jgi:hypothetical protein
VVVGLNGFGEFWSTLNAAGDSSLTLTALVMMPLIESWPRK